jgi:hypothetical protein
MDRVWIELEKPDAQTSNAEETGNYRASLLTRMLNKLCEPSECLTVRWNHKERKYQIIYSPMRIETLHDDGQWFDLEYLGRE